MGQKASTIVVGEITAHHSFNKMALPPLLMSNPSPLAVDDSYVLLT